MLIITRGGVEALRERLKNHGEAAECREELKRMLEIKEALLWRAEARTCCNIPWDLRGQLDWEIRLLEGALAALEDGHGERASSILEDYASHLEYEPY